MNDLLNVEGTEGGICVDDAGRRWVLKVEPGGGKIGRPKDGVGCGVRVLLISAGMTILPLGNCEGPTSSRAG